MAVLSRDRVMPAATIARLGGSMLRTLARRFAVAWAPRSPPRRRVLRERRSLHSQAAAATRRTARRWRGRVLHRYTSDSARNGRDPESPAGEVDRRAPECLFR